MLFTVFESAQSCTLWRTDGTTSGTQKVLGLPAGTSNQYPTVGNSYIIIDDKAYFVFTDEQHGTELWVSNGTSDGTYVIDVTQGIGSSDPGILTNVQGTLYFKAQDQLWKTDDVETSLVSKLEPLEILAFKEDVYFTAIHPDYGAELFRIAIPEVVSGLKDVEESIVVYPNPTEDDVTIALSDHAGASIEILDALGRRIATYQLKGKEAIKHSFKNCPDGFYLVRAKTAKETSYHKIIKK